MYIKRESERQRESFIDTGIATERGALRLLPRLLLSVSV